jgi:hypothetical protein
MRQTPFRVALRLEVDLAQERPDGLVVRHELGVRVGMRRVPGPQKEVELHPDVVVPHRRKARHLDRVRPDPVGDVVPFLEEGNETV